MHRLRKAIEGSALRQPDGRGPIGTLEVYAAGLRDWNDSEVAALQAYAGVVASLLRAAAAARAKGSRPNNCSGHGSIASWSSRPRGC